jgi:hypothetical protein
MAALTMSGCGETALDYGFVIREVSVVSGYQSLNIRLQQDLDLSQQAREALQHGVTLTVSVDMELRNDNNMIVVKREARRFHVRYLPLSERYQMSEGESERLQTFTRLRHVLANIADLNIELSTGPLPQGNYELRTRSRVDESTLPGPMQLPALFSSQWRHDSEWSVWPFEISA